MVIFQVIVNKEVGKCMMRNTTKWVEPHEFAVMMVTVCSRYKQQWQRSSSSSSSTSLLQDTSLRAGRSHVGRFTLVHHQNRVGHRLQPLAAVQDLLQLRHLSIN